MENVRKHRDIKLVTTDVKRNKLVSEPNYYTAKRFSENFVSNRNEKNKSKMNEPVYLGMSVLDISKTLMYKFGMITLSQSMRIENILIALLFIL